MKALLLPLLVIASLYSQICQAQFELTGPVTVTLADDTQENSEFGFAFLQHDGAYEFRVGQHKMAVEEVPKRYTLALMLNKEQLVWARDLHKKPIKGFAWQIGKHQLKLFQQAMKPARPGDFVLTIDDVRYHFVQGRQAQIHFSFDNKGIVEIEVEAMLQPKR